MFGIKQQGKLVPMIGIDFGSQTIKAVVVGGEPGKFRLEGCAEVAIPKGSIQDYQLQDIDKVSQAVRQLIRLLPVRHKYAATAVTGSNVITKITQVDSKMSPDELENHILVEAEQLIPFPVDEISLDFEILGPNLNEPAHNDVLISAARTDSIIGRVSALQEVELTVKVVDVGLHALGRAVVATLPELEEEQASKVCALVDIGAVSLTFGVLHGGEIIYSRLQSFGGENLSQSLAAFFSMSLEEAEQGKVQNRLPAESGLDVVAPHITQLIQHIRRNIQLFCSASSHREVDMLVLSGGGSLLPGLAQQLELELQLEVRHPDPFALAGKSRLNRTDHGAKYMTALGLALRSFTPCQI